MQDSITQEGPHNGEGEDHDKERLAETWHYDPNPYSPPPCTAQREDVEKSGMKLSLGRNEGWGKGGFSFSHYPTLLQLAGNKLN